MRSHVLLFVALLLPGCQSLQKGGDRNPAISGAIALAIADDLASRLAEQVPPSAIRVPAKSSELAMAFEKALKDRGYTISTAPPGPAGQVTDLTWEVQAFDGHVLAQVSTPTLVLSRAYLLNGTQALPANPVSLMQKG